MSEHKIKTLSNISPIGIEALSNTACVLDEESKDQMAFWSEVPN